MRAHHILIKAATLFRRTPAGNICKLNFHTSDVQMMLITGSEGGARCCLLSFSTSSPSSRLVPSSFHPVFIFSFIPSPHFISPPSLASSSSSATLCLFTSRRGAAVTGCRSRRHGNAWRCVRLWKHPVSRLEGAGGCEWILHTIACCFLVSGWRGSDDQILNSEDAELLLCHHIEKSLCLV